MSHSYDVLFNERSGYLRRRDEVMDRLKVSEKEIVKLDVVINDLTEAMNLIIKPEEKK